MQQIAVEATRDDVIAVLRDGLTAEEFSTLEFGEQSPDDGTSFAPDPRRAEPVTAMTILIWVASGMVGNAAYDLTKKAVQVLSAKFGPDNVAERDAN